MAEEKIFNKYKDRGSVHWREMTSRDPRRFNAFQQARYDWIIKTAGDMKGKRVLDLGCGDGSLTYMLCRAGAHVVGADNEDMGIKFARENLASQNVDNKLHYEFVVASAYSLPFENASFDIIAHCEVIEHLAEPERMLAEAKRVMKTDGKFIVTTPHRLHEFPKDPNHVREFFPEELKALLQKFFPSVEIKLTHQIMWYALHSYSVRHFGNRQLGFCL